MSETVIADMKVVGVVVCDFERAAIGTRSRLGDVIGGKMVLGHVVEKLLKVEGVSEIVLLARGGQEERAREFVTDARVQVMTLVARSANVEARVRIGRAWGLSAWRGGAGQFTCFDEEYHPAGVAAACVATGAEHVLVVHSHSAFLDVEMTGALVQHHLHKNHEMRVTYTPCAPGLTGMCLRADIALEMGEKVFLPWQLLAYEPTNPQFDTLIRDACMQVDPALSKIPNRFCVDTERSWELAQRLWDEGPFGSSAELALAAARVVAPGVRDLSQVAASPKELEIELTGKRVGMAPGSVPKLIREGRGELDVAHWVRWLGRQAFADDLLVTLGGDGDALLYGGVVEVLRAARKAGVLSICLQTELACGEEAMGRMRAIVTEGLVDVVTVPMYGWTAETYDWVAGAAGMHVTMMRNLAGLSGMMQESARGSGVPLIVPRLLKVRETIPQLEAFFDGWIEKCGWAMIDYPTDRAGSVAFAGVVDMAPPKRKACRRLWERVVVRANGVAVACDQDVEGRLAIGHIESGGVIDWWGGEKMIALRGAHAEGKWDCVVPCVTCREWHRA